MEKQEETVAGISENAMFIGQIAVRTIPCYFITLTIRGFYLYHWEGRAAPAALLFPHFWWAVLAVVVMGSFRRLYRRQKSGCAGKYSSSEITPSVLLKTIGNAFYDIMSALFLVLWAIGLFG